MPPELLSFHSDQSSQWETGRNAPSLHASIGDHSQVGLVVGIGCRRGVAREAIEAAIRAALARIPQWNGSIRPTVGLLASVEAKADESGLLSFAERHALPLRFFSVDTLAETQEKAVTPRAPAMEGTLREITAVQRRFGIDNVCEAAARAACPSGTVLLPKTVFGNVTVAIVAPVGP